ncbi:MAG TPA: acyl-CoA reductase [Chitinophagales bacterium]|nr:acyl-CoA reductase [Chitinophagales bacterium]
MNLEKRISTICRLGKALNPSNPEINDVAALAYANNKWFTRENTLLMLESICNNFLNERKIYQWLSKYAPIDPASPKTVGLIMAGNIPLVGFHDLLCVMLSGHKALIKLSSKDSILLPWVLEKLFETDASWRSRISTGELLNGMEAAIATGSNNSSRYFNYYFAKYPHIIRKNRGSVAVLTGNESKEDLQQLGTDIFSYFGLGCRNVSKLMVPKDYSFDFFFESIETFHKVIEHNKYKNNFDYNLTLLMMNKEPHYNNNFLMLREDERIVSPVAMLHYERYTDQQNLEEKLLRQQQEIQCIAGENYIPFGKTQSPELWDYADNIDTMEFLSSLS